MSKTPSVFDVLISAGKKRTRASQGAEGGGYAPRKKQEQAQVRALKQFTSVLGRWNSIQWARNAWSDCSYNCGHAGVIISAMSCMQPTNSVSAAGLPC